MTTTKPTPQALARLAAADRVAKRVPIIPARIIQPKKGRGTFSRHRKHCKAPAHAQ